MNTLVEQYIEAVKSGNDGRANLILAQIMYCKGIEL